MNSYVSTYSMSSNLLQSILTAQSNLTIASQEVSTGTYADLGLQLGAGTAQDLTLHSEQSLLQTLGQTNNVAATRLSSTQTILGQLQSTAQNFLNTLLSSTGTTTASSIQGAAQNALQSLLAGLNTSVNGQYIFAGINTGTAPMSDGTSAVTGAFNTYLSSIGLSSATVSSLTGSQMQTFLNGSLAPLFQGASWTSSWSSASNTTLTSQISSSLSVATSVSANSSAFQDLAQGYSMLASLGTQNLSSDALSTATTTAEKLVQQGITGLINMSTGLGIVQSDITTSNSEMSSQMSILSSQINNLESINTYQASTQVTNLQTQIETAYSLTAQLHKVSLVNYL